MRISGTDINKEYCTVCVFIKLSFDELCVCYESVSKLPHFLCSFKNDYTFVGLLQHIFGLQILLKILGHLFPTSEATILAQDHWWGFSTRNAHMVYIVN